uniref:Uncharacterized protein n=1 Tax=Anguilla anguilla TaxID=7936 RepID=A0A0E9QL42_ANGAN
MVKRSNFKGYGQPQQNSPTSRNQHDSTPKTLTEEYKSASDSQQTFCD